MKVQQGTDRVRKREREKGCMREKESERGRDFRGKERESWRTTRRWKGKRGKRADAACFWFNRVNYRSERNRCRGRNRNYLESTQLSWTLRGLCEVTALLFTLTLLVDEKMNKRALTLFKWSLCSTCQCLSNGLFHALLSIQVIPEVFNMRGGTLSWRRLGSFQALLNQLKEWQLE